MIEKHKDKYTHIQQPLKIILMRSYVNEYRQIFVHLKKSSVLNTRKTKSCKTTKMFSGDSRRNITVEFLYNHYYYSPYCTVFLIQKLHCTSLN